MGVATITPPSFADAAGALAAAAGDGKVVRIRGGGTKLHWGEAAQEPDLWLSTSALDRVTEHNTGDLTAVVQAGVPLASLHERLAAKGQMLAVDPPLVPGGTAGATVGGVIATGDSGPLRHRYGAPRDLVLGMTIALSDGTVARSGGKVIKNVAGYDLAKLFTGSFGTLGVILSVSLRLHPLPVATATALGVASDPGQLARAAQAVTAAPLELECCDVAWRAGRGGLLARVGGAEAVRRGQRVAELMREHGLDQVDIEQDDAGLWSRQRAGQRSSQSALVRISGRPSRLARTLAAVDGAGGTLVGRAALGIWYVELEPEAIGRLREELPEADMTSVVVDCPSGAADPWGPADSPAIDLMRSVKRRFDPTGTCNPGIFVGAI